MSDSLQRPSPTDEQIRRIGLLVTEKWGAHFQTGWDVNTETAAYTGNLVLWTKIGPAYRVERTVIYPDGTVTHEE